MLTGFIPQDRASFATGRAWGASQGTRRRTGVGNAYDWYGEIAGRPRGTRRGERLYGPGRGRARERAGKTPGSTQGKTPPSASKTDRSATPGDDKPGGTTPSAAPKVLWSRGDKGNDVREVQARLHQVAWLIAAPTGTYDTPTVTAVKGFQGKRGLPRTGELDAVTWERLRG